MRDVYIAAASMSQFGRLTELDMDMIAGQVALETLKMANLKPKDIQAVYCGHRYGGYTAAQRISRLIGISGVKAVNVENACASGSSAIHDAFQAIASGLEDVALIIGVEQLTRAVKGLLPLDDYRWMEQIGITMPAVFALVAQRYMDEYDLTREDFANVSVKNHLHGTLNAKAQYQKAVTLEEVLNAREVASPLGLLDCCPICDGAAALVLVSENVKDKLVHPLIKVAACVSVSGILDEDLDYLGLRAAQEAAKRAYEYASVEAKDIDVAEVHDCFSVAEVVAYEDLGFCNKGEAAQLIRSKATYLGGKLPVNPSGGLLAKGHPLGATGVAQLVELYEQLTGNAGSRQVEGARIGLAHNAGGILMGSEPAVCNVTILERES